MPPSPLHPRSSQTLSLFTSTLLLSFLVVSLPHLIPCPSDSGRRRAFADGEPMTAAAASQQQQRQRRARGANAVSEVEDGGCAGARELRTMRAGARECPVPRPGSLVGKLMGTGDAERGRESLIVRVERRRREMGPGEEKG